MSTRLILGPGYLGLRVAAHWRSAGDRVYAVTRTKNRAAELRAAGFDPIIADVTDPTSLAKLHAADTLLYSVGHDRTSSSDIHAVYAEGLKNVLAAIPSSTQRVIYISTTGVYGPAAGQWVDELTTPDPRRGGGRASLAAEHILATHPCAPSSAVLRLAGIYGPGRIPYLAELRSGQPIAAPSQGWLNLIHVDDAARIVVEVDRWLAAQTVPARPHVFNVADGAPVVRGDYYGEAARLIGAPPPQFTAPPPDSPAAARAGADRRIDASKLRTALGLALLHPTYRQGLAAILNPS